MEFLKALFSDGGALTYDQLAEKVKAAKLNLVNLADGGYVSQAKFDDKVNGLTQQVTDLQGQIAQRDTDMSDLKNKLTAAQTDATKLGEVQQSFSDLQSKYNTDKTAYEKKLSDQAYEFRVRELAGGLQFSSVSARKAFIQEAIGKGFKMDGESLLGYEDFVTKYKADDPGAFAAAKAPDDGGEPNGGKPNNAPAIVLPGNGKSGDNAGPFHFSFNGVRPAPADE